MMTIKQRLFFSNIRVFLVTLGGLIIAFITNRLITTAMFRAQGFQGFDNFESYRRFSGSVMLVSFVVFIAFFIIINSILSKRMTKKITKPLEILNGGVNQIHKNNFAYRIEYHEDDEFRPVCEAFNQMAAQLEDSTEQRLKDEANRRELLAGISHDLRTPLTTINGYLDGLESGVASTPQMREQYFTTIKKRAADMTHIIDQLFLFSKLDMNEFPFTPSRFDIARALSDIIEEITEEYETQGLDITIAECPQNIFVYVDVVHIRRVFINIFENSMKYKEKENALIKINVSVDSNFVQLTFADDGPGVNPEALPNLFNAFYRTDPSRHTKGSGLGLAISAKIIERSGGAMYAENDRGLTVIIRLPIDTGAASG